MRGYWQLLLLYRVQLVASVQCPPAGAPIHRQAHFNLLPHPCSNTTQPCQELFCPIYSLGVSEDPLLDSENATQLHLAVGLDSGEPCKRTAVAAVMAVVRPVVLSSCTAIHKAVVCRTEGSGLARLFHHMLSPFLLHDRCRHPGSLVPAAQP